MKECAYCGAETAGGGFCPKCGQKVVSGSAALPSSPPPPPASTTAPPVAAPAAPAPQPPPPIAAAPVPTSADPVGLEALDLPVSGESRDGSGSNKVIVGGVVAALLAVIVGLTAALFVSGDDATDAPQDDSVVADSGAAAMTPSTASGEDTEVEEGQTTSSSGPAYTCWDGSSADNLPACGEPTGADGLAWVFPKSSSARCKSTGRGARVAETDCLVRASSGALVRVHYSEWRSWDDGFGEYSSQNVQGAVTRWGDFLRWYIDPRETEWNYKVALLYRDAPWSVTVYGRTVADRDEVLRNLVVRPARDLLGERAS